jgi:hypothetical protein
MPHEWTELDALVALYLTKFYEDSPSRFSQDVLVIRLRNHHPTITGRSIGMAIRNFRFLFGWPGGLSSVSQLGRDVFRDYSNLPLEQLKAEIDRRFNG